MKRIYLSALVAIVAIFAVVGFSNKSEAAVEMPCVNDPVSMAGHSVITYTNEGGIPIVGYRTQSVCNALDYKWTTNTGYTTWTTHPRLTSDASIFGCGAAWISVQARLQGGAGFSNTLTKNVTVNCLPF